ncbi:hypothetical protein Kpho02_50300 [Kitasatospora phosalacinea]|uniref:Uncharacterized protein n=1 Tax=Kitasatospora phosalacinea TaxID=2065 RepID=A0A9W6QC86_9ACTN|nr:hypothetical protein [Kitasatospora phosalacinea]GLW72731.1 hypothetical protein Kpho02_50300 [Kitasatospora phosalacinea]
MDTGPCTPPDAPHPPHRERAAPRGELTSGRVGLHERLTAERLAARFVVLDEQFHVAPSRASGTPAPTEALVSARQGGTA